MGSLFDDPVYLSEISPQSGIQVHPAKDEAKEYQETSNIVLGDINSKWGCLKIRNIP